MKYVEKLPACRTIGVQCECDRIIDKSVVVFMDAQGYLVIKGDCSVCGKTLQASFSLHELKILIPQE